MSQTTKHVFKDKLTECQKEVIIFIETQHTISWTVKNPNQIKVFNKLGFPVRTLKPNVVDSLIEKEVLVILTQKRIQKVVLNQNKCQLREF